MASPTGQNPTGQTAPRPPGLTPRSGPPSGSSASRDGSRRAPDREPDVARCSAMRFPFCSGPGGLCRPGLAREPDLQAILDEAGLADGEALQGLREDEVALVRADLDEQLVAAPVDVEVLARGKRKPHREHVRRASLADPDRVFVKED